MDLIALLFAAPMMPSRVKLLHREQAAKPLHPTSVGSQRALQPLLRLSSMSSWYLSRLRSLASSIRSSHGTVSSSKRTCLDEADVSTTSGLKQVDVTISGNLSCLPKSTRSSQSGADESKLATDVICDRGCSPAFTKAILLWLRTYLLLATALEMASATDFRTWSCRQR